MTRPDAYDRVIEKHHLSFKVGSPDDPKYPEPEFFLRDCPRGICPYCRANVENTIHGSIHWSRKEPDCGYDQELTEDENRIRYAAERLEDAMVRQP